MFFVFNKPKIYSYLIVLSTVVVLFFTAEVLSEANNLETLTTSAETVDDNVVIERFDTNDKEIAITINCLETDKNVKEILDIANKYNVKFSFAISGDWVKKYPEVTMKIDTNGNNIIGLTNKYEDISNFNYEDTKKSIKEGINKINKLVNKDITLIRCPYGKNSNNIEKVAEENEYKIIGWSIDTLDYQGLEANVIWDNIKNRITNGDIILMNSNSEHILEELETVIKSVHKRGYTIVNIEEKL